MFILKNKFYLSIFLFLVVFSSLRTAKLEDAVEEIENEAENAVKEVEGTAENAAKEVEGTAGKSAFESKGIEEDLMKVFSDSKE